MAFRVKAEQTTLRGKETLKFIATKVQHYGLGN